MGATDIGLADVVRAWRALGAVSDDERRAVARLLGFDLKASEGAKAETAVRSMADGSSGDTRVGTGEAASPDVEPEPAPRTPWESPATPIYLTPLDPVQDNPPRLPSEWIPRPSHGVAEPLESLFAGRWTRVIAGTLTAHRAAMGAIDVERVVEAMARRQLLRTVPRRFRLVSANSITVVVDVRGTIAWFREDADQLIKRLDTVTRSQITTVISDGVPTLATAGALAVVTDEDDEEEDDEEEDASLRVRAGARIIGITDLGVSRGRRDPGRTRRWIAFAAALKERRVSLVIVTPVALERIPPALQRTAACVHWDESTRPGLIHRKIKGLG